MKLKNYLISGTLIIVPAAISIWILWKIFVFFEGILGQWLQKVIPNFYVKGLGLVSLIILILILGFLAQNVFGKRLVRYLEELFLRIPVFNRLYNFVHSILQHVFRKEKQIFHEVVLIHIADQISTIGFVTEKKSINRNKGADWWMVFVPTTPNPTTGLILEIHKNKLTVLPIDVETAMKVLLSFGIYDILNEPDQSKSHNPKED
ncbi:MAG TPA: DUF502 domain-containing protein [bacterium]|nr:DUF502 domain-containing protein [bacterium]